MSDGSARVDHSPQEVELQRSEPPPFSGLLIQLCCSHLKLFFCDVGVHLGSEASGSVRMKKDGLFLFISPISGAHQGRYVCLVNETSGVVRQAYDLTVTGGKHAWNMWILPFQLL